MKRKGIRKLLDVLSLLVIICLPTLLWTFNHIDRYYNWLFFYSILILVGAVIGFLIYQFVSKENVELREYRTKTGVGLFHAIIAISVMLTPLIGLIINENLGVTSTKGNYKIEKTGESGSRIRASYIFIKNKNNKIERLQFGKAFVNKYAQRDSVLLNYNIGCLGFGYYSIPKKEN